MYQTIKRAWISHENQIISFHEMDSDEIYEAEEDIFWNHIIMLVTNGYRVQ